MHPDPILAVVVANHDYEAFVPQAIASVLDQGRDDVELFVVDDGSTDGSWDVVSALSARHGFGARRIPNGGQLRACLEGVSSTRAPFVLFLDADDLLAPGSLDVLVPLLVPGVSKVQFALAQVDAAGRPLGPANPALPDSTDTRRLREEVLSTGVYVSPPTSGNVFRRDVLDLLREVDYERSVDGVVLFAAPFAGDVVSLSAELGRYRLHGSNVSGGGKPPTVGAAGTELRRFEARHAHLARHLARIGAPAPVDGRATFFHRERSLYLLILEGDRPSPATLPALLLALARQPLPVRRKVALAVVLGLLCVLPNDRARAVLAERFKLEGRSVRAVVAAAVRRPSTPTPTDPDA